MNLHLSLDEKFTDFVINDLMQLGLLNENKFVIYTYDDLPIRYIKSKEYRRILIDSEEWQELFRSEIKKYDRVFLHLLDQSLYELLPLIPHGIKIIWLFFGIDGFNLFDGSYFLQPLSKRSFNDRKELPIQIAIKTGLLPFFKEKKLHWENQHIKKKAFQRVDYFGHFLFDDYTLIKRKSNAKFQFVPFTFNSLEALEYNSQDELLGDNILIGNSSSITNNHFEVLEKFKSIDYGDRKIYFPLSYGSKTYSVEIERKAKDILGANFIPVKDFVPLNEYKKLLNTCGFVIMNHNRSQASDNVLICLSNGAKVFMSEDSPLYIFLKGIGVEIFSVQNDLNNSSSLFEPLSDRVKLDNKTALKNYFGQAAHEQRLLKILSI
jgi:dTDP-N-acetylfucosamine:lipid II N-acetylfucosaminyltransferase